MKTPDITALPAELMLERASRALGKIDLHGPRGVTMVSADECEAMALLLATLGLVPTRPGAAAPAVYFPTFEGEVQ